MFELLEEGYWSFEGQKFSWNKKKLSQESIGTKTLEQNHRFIVLLYKEIEFHGTLKSWEQKIWSSFVVFLSTNLFQEGNFSTSLKSRRSRSIIISIYSHQTSVPF
jgi:hypothetical protein